MALYWLQLATFVLPLLTLPYVARVLEPSGFGLVLFAQGFTFFLVVFIDWGFGLTGARAIATNQQDGEALAEVVRRVRGAQLLLVVASALVAAAALAFIPTMREHPGFGVLAWVAAAAFGLSPNWFFLGLERARVTAFVQLGFRVLGVVLTFALVRDSGDAWAVVVLLAGSAVGGWLVCDVLMYRHVPFRWPAWRQSVQELRAGTTIFVGALAVSLVTSFSVVLLGFFEPSSSVAHFGAAERLVRISITLLAPIGAAVIPRMTALQAAGERERAQRLLIIAVAAGTIPGLLIMLVLIVFAWPILRVVYGADLVDASVPILRVLALLIPVNVAGAVFGVWLMSLHRDRLIMMIALTAGVSNIVLGAVLTTAFGPIGMAWSVIAAEAIGATGGLIAVRRNARRAAAAAAVAPEPSSTVQPDAAAAR